MPDHRSFADDVRGRSADELTALLLLRPDLADPVPDDLSTIVARAAGRSSVQQAMAALSADRLQLIDAFLAGLEIPDDPATTAAVEDLWARGLLWRSPNGLSPVRATGEVPFPGRLGPRLRSLTDQPLPADLTAAIDGLSEPARGLLESMATRHPIAHPQRMQAPERAMELLDAGLAVRRDDHVVLPLEVGLAVRGGSVVSALEPPSPTQPARPAAEIDTAGGLAAIALIRHVEALGELWSTEAPPVMRKGGLSVREQRTLEGQLGLDPAETAFVTELACAAGLFASDRQIDAHWRPTQKFDDWVELDPAERWAQLANAWWLTTRAASLVGTRGPSGTVNLLGPQAEWPLMLGRRQAVLGVLSDLSAVPTATELDALLNWHRPLALPPGAPTRAAEVLREAAWCGLAVGRQLTTAGRALVTGELDGETLRPLLPQLVDQVFIQPDLTAIAPGPLTDDLHRLMHNAAAVESRGGATVFRFSDRSVSHALDAGLTAGQLRDALARACPTPLPQPLTYLIDDAARRHGRTLVGAATAYVRSTDEAGLAALVADSTLAPLGLRLIAPTVAVAAVAPGRLITALRKAGHGALAESAEGVAVALGSAAERAVAPREQVRHDAVAPDPDRVRQIVELAQSQTSTGFRADRRTEDPSVLLGILQDAIADERTVRISYARDRGRVMPFTVRPLVVNGGRLIALHLADGQQRPFELYRIRSVSSA